MGEIVEISELDLQEAVVGERKERLLKDFLREEMDGVDHHKRKKWKMFQRRLGLRKMSCCGARCSFRAAANMGDREDKNEEEEEVRNPGLFQNTDLGPRPSPSPSSGPPIGMNLAAALAAERQFRAAQELEPTSKAHVTLFRLLEETNYSFGIGDGEREKEKVVGNDSMCCVCMGRKKGAAFIPCGHTFCRVCSREIWLNRGSCPLCNRSIVEILDIF